MLHFLIHDNYDARFYFFIVACHVNFNRAISTYVTHIYTVAYNEQETHHEIRIPERDVT